MANKATQFKPQPIVDEVGRLAAVVKELRTAQSHPQQITTARVVSWINRLIDVAKMCGATKDEVAEMMVLVPGPATLSGLQVGPGKLDCPACEAPPGEPCATNAGKILSYYHTDRWQALAEHDRKANKPVGEPDRSLTQALSPQTEA